GVSWRLIPVSDGSAARSLAVGAEGRVFVGGIEQLGYLAPDSAGRMRYVSLVDHIAPEDRKFGNVWNIEKAPDGIYCRTYERLLRWNGREMKVWRSATRFWMISALGDVVYAQQEGIGLMRMDDDSLGLAPGGVFFQDKRIWGLVPQGEAAYLVVTRNHGMFRCPAPRHSEAACTLFSPGLTDLLAALQPYHTTVVAEGIVAIATRRGGVVLLDRTGRLLRILNEASGLRDEIVRSSFVDRQGGLWLALNNGLARVEIGAPLSYWNKTAGLDGNVKEVARHQGRLYAATTLGVYSLASASEGAAPRFLPCPGISTQCWALLSTPQGLLAGCQGGLYNVDDQQLILPHNGHVLEVVRSRRDTTLLYLGLGEGLARLVFTAGQWTEVGRHDHHDSMHTIVADAPGRLGTGPDSA
ncbi:MAG: hypothetical protein GY778_12495, partial [bacterium]|nr:hypothetical protein [bacterium]